MGIYVNRGNASFSRARKSQIYVDKSGLLEYTNSVLGTEQCYICVSRPRRFGKTMAAGMLAAYYGKECDSRTLFADLKIAESADYEEHLNKYDVIHFDIADLRFENENAVQIAAYIQRSVINELRDIYPSAADNKETSLPSVLAQINEQTGQNLLSLLMNGTPYFVMKSMILRHRKHT